MQALGAAVRSTVLTDRSREIAILVVGRHCGLTETELADLREARDLHLADSIERACLDLTRALVEGDVDV